MMFDQKQNRASIEEQPLEIRVLEEIRHTVSQIDAVEIEQAVQVLARSKRVFLTGAGRSLLVMRAFAMRLMHFGLTAYVVGDTTTPAITADDLLVIGSGSGETKGLISQAEKAKAIGCHILLFTIFPASSLAQIVQSRVIIPGATSKSIDNPYQTRQPGGNLFEQSLLIFLDCLIIRLGERLHIDFSRLSQLHANLE